MKSKKQRLEMVEYNFVSLLAEVLMAEEVLFDPEEPLQLLCTELEGILRHRTPIEASWTRYQSVDSIIPLHVVTRQNNHLCLQALIWLLPSECTPLVLNAHLIEHNATAQVSLKFGVPHVRLQHPEHTTTIQKFFTDILSEEIPWMYHLDWTTTPESAEVILV